MSAIARPASVTLVGVLILIMAIFSVFAAVLGLLNSEMRVGATLVSLVVVLVIGLIYLALAKGIFSGNNFARLVIGVLSVIGLLSGLYHLIFISELRLVGLGQIVFELIILALLFNRKAGVFFAMS